MVMKIIVVQYTIDNLSLDANYHAHFPIMFRLVIPDNATRSESGESSHLN